MTVPGVGPVTAVRFLAAIDDPTRFRGAHAVEAYVGLVGGQRSSGVHESKEMIGWCEDAVLRQGAMNRHTTGMA